MPWLKIRNEFSLPRQPAQAKLLRHFSSFTNFGSLEFRNEFCSLLIETYWLTKPSRTLITLSTKTLAIECHQMTTSFRKVARFILEYINHSLELMKKEMLLADLIATKSSIVTSLT